MADRLFGMWHGRPWYYIDRKTGEEYLITELVGIAPITSLHEKPTEAKEDTERTSTTLEEDES